MKRQIPHGPEGFTCPFHKADMSTVCHKCPLWIQIRGMHPQTGEEVDRWNCSFSELPLLIVETAKETRQSAAATESMRNEIVLRMDGARRVPQIR